MKKPVKKKYMAELEEVEEVEPAEEANAKQIGGTHYKGVPIEHWDFVQMHEMPYMEAQIFKYVFRWREKNGMADLYKAQHFLQKLIEFETKKAENGD